MTLFILAILVGFVLLIWSADRFVDGAAVSAKYAGMPSLLIGMIVVGFVRRLLRCWYRPWLLLMAAQSLL